METIDVHAHLAIEEWFGELRKDYPESVPRMEKEGDSNLYSVFAGRDSSTTMHVPAHITDVPKRLQWLKKVKITKQLIAPVPSLMFTKEPVDVALALTRAQNNGISEVVKEHPEELGGICSVPLQEPERALPELERAVHQLGMKGVEIGTNINGMNLDDRSLWPFYSKVQELNVPVMVHPINVAAADRLEKYYLSNLIGNPLDTSIAIASVILGGVLRDFPRLKLFFVHGAGFTPYQRGRLDHGFNVRPEPKVTVSQKPSTFLPRIYTDTIVHFNPALEYLIEVMGATRIVLGSDAPFDMGPKDPVSPVMSIKLSPQDRKKILSENAKRLFGLKD